MNPDLSDIVAHKPAQPASSRSKDARALRSANALRDALLALLLKKPFDQITIRDICAESGVHYATFFRHHQTKESLLDEIAKDQIRQLNALSVAIWGHESFEAGFRALCQYVEDHRSLWATLLNGGAGAAMREEWVRVAVSVASDETDKPGWLPEGLGTICAATLIAETLAWWVGQPSEAYSVDEVADILFKLLTRAILPSE